MFSFNRQHTMYGSVVLLLAIAGVSTAELGNDVNFGLYTRKNPDHFMKLLPNLNKIDVNKNVKILIHGWFDSAHTEWYTNATSEYLKKEDCSVIQVDWSRSAAKPYPNAALYTQKVGKAIAKLITTLHDNYTLPLTKVHLIGHCLGAHAAGYAGKKIINKMGSSVFRITALDPTLPQFEGLLKMYDGLEKTDARVVDVIHTDGGIFGREQPVGDADFYPNGGVALQPGCGKYQKIVFPPTNPLEFKQEVFCSHTKSYYYFVASINQESFIGQKCTSWKDYQGGKCRNGSTAVMGANYVFTNNTTGSFFLKTNAAAPFTKNVPTN